MRHSKSASFAIWKYMSSVMFMWRVLQSIAAFLGQESCPVHCLKRIITGTFWAMLQAKGCVTARHGDSLSDDPGPVAAGLWVIRVLKRLMSAKCCFISVPSTMSMSRALNPLCSLFDLCTKKLHLPSSLLSILQEHELWSNVLTHHSCKKRSCKSLWKRLSPHGLENMSY